MKNKAFRAAVIVVLLALMGCSGGHFKYSSFHPNFTIDNARHLDQTLNSAMNPTAKGVFCMITFRVSAGAKYFVFTNNQGLSTQKIFNAVDERLQSQTHLGQNGGLIVGYGNLSEPAEFYAYDAECPNCFDPSAIPVRSYRLTMDANGLAHCSHCNRQYNMNTGGNVTNNTGRGLTAYRATTTGPNGILHVY